jgi:hypothetical protein
MVPEAKINQAKKAQMKRMGGLVSGSMRKRCKKGKSCGAACINNSKVCWVDFPWAMGSSIGKMRDTVQSRKKPKAAKQSSPYTVKSFTPETVGSVSYWKLRDLKGVKDDAKEILNDLKTEVGVKRTDGAVKEKDVNWNAALGSGVRFVGRGSFGGFAAVPPEKFLKKGGNKYPDGTGIKAGNIGVHEVKVLKALQNSDIAPRILGSRVSSEVEKDSYGFETSKGVIAMTRVPGKRFADSPSTLANGKDKSDAYWEAVARLHKLGVAHNDMHGGNVYIDSNGKGRFVDLGLAQLSPKAALAEALGFKNGANYQFEGSSSFGHGLTASRNLDKVRDILESKGLSPSDIATIMRTTIRQSDDHFDRGAWARLSDTEAKALINTLYEGIV